jgi:DNA polymerase-3 subunit gamma/tau
LSRVVRDLLVLNVDPSRASDPEIAGEAERDAVVALAARFSREDLLRAFDLLTRAEFDIRSAAQPRYHLEMALLRWMHLRKLMPIEDLIAAAGGNARLPTDRPGSRGTRPPAATEPAAIGPSLGARVQPIQPQRPPAGIAPPPLAHAAQRAPEAAASQSSPVPAPPAAPVAGDLPAVDGAPVEGRGDFKDAFLAEIRKTKFVFYSAVVVQAQQIEVTADRVTFSFSSSQRALRDNCEQNRAWLESTAQKIAGRRVVVMAAQADTPAAAPGAAAPPDAAAARKIELREQALADAGVQALLEVFPAEIRDVEEM